MRLSFASAIWAFHAVKHRWGVSLALIVMLSLGWGALMGLQRIQRASDSVMEIELQGIDVILSAKGSPLQSLLANVFHADDPTGNVSIQEVEHWMHYPGVAKALPIAYGDTYKGVRIVGCSLDYFDARGVLLTSGRWPKAPMEAVVGYRAAERLGLDIGDTFHGAHGIEGDAGDHDGQDYTVVGLCESPSQTSNRLIFTLLSSVWEVHHEGPKEYTAVLLEMETPMASLLYPALVNRKSTFMAVSPAIEVNRLRSLLDQGTQWLSFLAYVLTAVSFGTLALLLWIQVKERTSDYALLRSMGGSWFQIISVVAWQNLWIAFLGWLLAWTWQPIWISIYTFSGPSQWDIPLSLIAWHRADVGLLGWSLVLSLVCSIAPVLYLRKANLHQALSSV